MKIRNQVWALGILLLATGLTQGSCDLWRQWTESGDLEFRWKAEVGGRLLAPPLVDQGRVFAATHDDDARFSTVVGFDAASGKQLWKFTPPEKEMSEHSMLASGGKLFFPALGGVYYCLDGATGQVVWKTNLGRESFKRGLLHKGRLYIPGSLFYPSRSPV
ncbi:MAG: PQQ-like beta-propeller repeat protein, partial [Deltaproteobacteria bacterium]|nr:PQQ-like beta-propeller repeat protein [Deltaproteobacteria bacterium]